MLFIKRIKNVYLFIYHLKRVCVYVLWVQVYKEDISPSTSMRFWFRMYVHGRRISSKGSLFCVPWATRTDLDYLQSISPIQFNKQFSGVPSNLISSHRPRPSTPRYTHYIIAIIRKEHPICWNPRAFTYKPRHVVVILFRSSTSTSSARVNIYLYIYQKSKVC